MEQTNEEGEKIRSRSAALIAVLISIGAVMGQMNIGPLNLTKTAEPTMTYVGGQVTYTYVVNNTGDVDLSAVSLSDDALGHIAGPFNLPAGTWLTFQVTTNIENDILNNATAAGLDPDGKEIGDIATAFVDVIHPNLTLTKTANSTMIYRNQAVNYTFFINNTGDVDIRAINLTDDQLGKIAGSV